MNETKMKILITGGNGLIGMELANQLRSNGKEVAFLSRKKTGIDNASFRIYNWDIDKGYIDDEALDGTSVIVHLAGENISEKRWTNSQKKKIEDSRIKSAELLYNTCKKLNKMPAAFISSSAIGYYGSFNSDRILTESDQFGIDFLAQICNKWEKTAELFEKEGVRTVKIRTGVVLSSKGAAYTKMASAAKWGMGTAFGSGNQIVPWIHIDDIVSIFIKAVEDENMKGAYNGVSPNNITNRELTRAISKSLKKPYFLPPIPEFIIKAIFGEMSVILLKGSKISAEKILNEGFKFRFPDIVSALENLAKNES